MIGLALRLLFGERAKYVLLLSGLSCSTFLMLQGMSLGFGVISFSYATADNVRSPVWVVDPMVRQVNDSQPLRETDVDRVRSVDGVAWAVPLYLGLAQVRLLDQGVGKMVTLVGLDATTLFGAPGRIIEGSIEDLRLPDAVMVDEGATKLLSADPGNPLRVGDTFEMNDRRAVIVAICFAKPSFIGAAAYVFTTFSRAVQFVPGQRKMVTHILVVPEEGRSLGEVTRTITATTGLRALTEDELKSMTGRWFIEENPAPIVIAIIVVVGFVIGTLVSGQTFYSYVLENKRCLGVLRAMGTDARTLSVMILVQALFVGFVGFGIGFGIISGLFLVIPEKVPLLMTWPVPVSVLVANVGICLFAAVLGIARTLKFEPAIVFRG